jgi:hypothetical protein
VWWQRGRRELGRTAQAHQAIAVSTSTNSLHPNRMPALKKISILLTLLTGIHEFILFFECSVLKCKKLEHFYCT